MSLSFQIEMTQNPDKFKLANRIPDEEVNIAIEEVVDGVETSSWTK
jgi:predicted signal transduction protein with EAL and GGDEF domain